MQLNGTPNKFEIFQDFYYVQNGVQISYAEALRLFAEMDADTRSDFEDYYRDEVGYEILLDEDGDPINIPPYTTANGYNLDRKRGNAATKGNINVKYTLDAYAKENGLVLDPQWAIYSAEEILQMVNEGVNVPQDVIDIANTIMQSTTSNAQEVEGEDGQEDTTLSFLELIPEAEKKIEKCEENNEKIEKEIQDLIPEQQKQKKEFDNSMEEQLAQLDTYENNVREWKRLNDKLNNGDQLTDHETKRYGELSELLQDKQSKDKDSSINKTKISASLNQLNILSVIGEKLADETIEIGETLADYTSKANYKTTFGQAEGEVGFLKAIISMAQGKALSKEADVIGNNTKEYSEITSEATNDIAEILDIELSEVQIDENGEVIQEENEDENNTEEEQEEDKYANFEITDESVLELIDEAKIINDETLGHVKEAKSFVKMAKTDIKFAEKASEKVEIVVNEYKEEEQQRQEEIAKRESENEEAQKEIEKLKEAAQKEQENETGITNIPNTTSKSNETDNKDDEENLDEETKAEIKNYEAIIDANNEEIEAIKVESEIAKAEVSAEVAPEKSYINKAVPAEAEALELVTKYAEEEIPEVTEDLNFTMHAGLILAGFGSEEVALGGYLINIGTPLLANPFTAMEGAYLVGIGTATVVKGTISIGIGIKAVEVSEDGLKLEENAEEINTNAIDKTGKAITDLTTLDSTIIGVTGEESALANVISNDEEDGENAEGVEGTEDGETPVDGEAPVDGETPVEGEEPVDGTEEGAEVVEEAEEKAEDAGVETPVVEEPAEDETETPTVEETAETVAEGAEETAEEETVNAVNTEETEEKEKSPEELAGDADKQQKQLEKQTDTQEDIVKDGNKDAKDAGKESKKIKKDEEKDAKQLEKETKKLQKEIQKEQEEVIELTKKSQKAVEKQQEILVEYEALNAESEQLTAEEEAKQASQPKQQAPQKKDNEEGGSLASNSFTITSTPDGTDNQSKLDQNSQRINELGIEFKAQDSIVVRSRTKITQIKTSISTKSEKFEKKIKLKEKKLKETEKKEKDKQKKLNKIFGAIGIAENIFSITTTTGTVLTQVGTGMESSGLTMIATGLGLMFPPAFPGAPLITAGTILKLNGLAVQSVGSVLTIIGTVGTIACGVTKGIINIANGNLAAGLMAIGSAAVTAATSFAGGGAAAGSALQYVSEGLSIVSSSAELVNNVRAVQGKEANGVMSKISTIAGVGSAVTGAASSVSNMGSQNTIGKIATITSAAGTALASTSQLMTEFGWGDEETANILGMVGGGLQTLGSIGQLANKNNKTENDDNKQDNKNNESKEDKMNKSIDKSNLTPEQKAAAKAAVQELKNNPNIAQAVDPAQRNAAIDAQLNSMNLSDKQKQKIKQDLQASGNYSKPQQPEQPQDTTPVVTDGNPNGQDAKPAPASDTEAKAPELEVTGVDAEGAEALRSENPAGTEPEAVVTPDEEADPAAITKPEDKVDETVDVPETDEDLPTFTEDELDADTETPEQGTPEVENTESPEEFRKRNMEENGASEEFADIDDDKLDEYRQDALGEYGKDSQEYKDIVAEQERRTEFKKNKAKEAKTEKINKILDVTGQTANLAMSVASMFMTQNQEGQTKKKHAAPGKLTARTKEIMRKNAKYRQRRVQALSRVQKYYA